MSSLSPLFGDLPDSVVTEALAAFRRERHMAGTTLIQESDTTNVAFVLEEGQVDVVQSGAIVATLQPGAVIGEIGLLTLAPRSATVVARTDILVAGLDRDAFDRLAQADNPVASRIERRAVGQLAHRFAQQAESVTAAAFNLPTLVVHAVTEPSDGLRVPFTLTAMAALLATGSGFSEAPRRHLSPLTRGARVRVFGRDEVLVDEQLTLHLLLAGQVDVMVARPGHAVRSGLVRLAHTDEGRLIGTGALVTEARPLHVATRPSTVLSLDPEVVATHLDSEGATAGLLRRAMVGSVYAQLQSGAELLRAAHHAAVEAAMADQQALALGASPPPLPTDPLGELWTAWCEPRPEPASSES